MVEFGKVKTTILERNKYKYENKYKKLSKTTHTKIFKIQAQNPQGVSEELIIKQFSMLGLHEGDQKNMLTQAKKEFNIHKSLYNRYKAGVVQLIAEEESPEDAFYEILMEYGGSTLYLDMNSLSGEEILDALYQCARILQVLLGAGVFHSDIKPKNFARTKDPNGRQVIKIFDFGVSQQFSQTMMATLTFNTTGVKEEFKIIGATMPYRSPEVLAVEKGMLNAPITIDASKRMDMYALGISFLELSKRYTAEQLEHSYRSREPKKGMSMANYAKIYEEWLTQETDTIRLQDVSQINSQKLTVILKSMLAFESGKRPTPEVLLGILNPKKFSKMSLPEVVKFLGGGGAPGTVAKAQISEPVPKPKAPSPDLAGELEEDSDSGEYAFSGGPPVVNEDDDEDQVFLKELSIQMYELADSAGLVSKKPKRSIPTLSTGSHNQVTTLHHYNPFMNALFKNNTPSKFAFKDFGQYPSTSPMSKVQSVTVVGETGRVFLITGSNPQSECLDTIYEMGANYSFKELCKLPKLKYGMGVVALGGNIYMIGGEVCTNTYTKECDCYRIGNSIHKIPELSEEKGGVSVCTFGKKYIYAFGGMLSPYPDLIHPIPAVPEMGDLDWESEELATSIAEMEKFSEALKLLRVTDEQIDNANLNPYSKRIERLTVSSMSSWEIIPVSMEIGIAGAGCIQVGQEEIMLFGGCNDAEHSLGNQWDTQSLEKSSTSPDYRVSVFNAVQNKMGREFNGEMVPDIYLPSSFAQSYYIKGKVYAVSAQDLEDCSVLYKYDVSRNKWSYGFLGPDDTA